MNNKISLKILLVCFACVLLFGCSTKTSKFFQDEIFSEINHEKDNPNSELYKYKITSTSDDDTYGVSKNNPIKIGDIERAYVYMTLLRDEYGDAFEIEASEKFNSENREIKRFKLTSKTSGKRKFLYFDISSQSQSKDFSLTAPKGIENLQDFSLHNEYDKASNLIALKQYDAAKKELKPLSNQTYFADYKLAVIFDNEENFTQSFKMLQTAANRGHIRAKCDLAQRYLNGVGTKKNQKKAYEIFQICADVYDDAYSQYVIGNAFLDGEVYDKNVPKAKEYLEKSSRQGVGPAMKALAKLYMLEEDNSQEYLVWTTVYAFKFKTLDAKETRKAIAGSLNSSEYKILLDYSEAFSKDIVPDKRY